MTTKPLQHRSFAADLEVRTEAGQRLITGRAAPYGVTTDIYAGAGSFRERFAPGAFARSIAERSSRVKLLANHESRSFPIGRPERLWEQPDGLYLEGRVSRTQAGDEALTLVADGVVTGLSVGFRPIRETPTSDDVIEVREAALMEISLTAFPAYPDAQILAVRSLDAARAYLDELEHSTPEPEQPLPEGWPFVSGRSLALAERELELLELEKPNV